MIFFMKNLAAPGIFFTIFLWKILTSITEFFYEFLKNNTDLYNQFFHRSYPKSSNLVPEIVYKHVNFNILGVLTTANSNSITQFLVNVQEMWIMWHNRKYLSSVIFKTIIMLSLLHYRGFKNKNPPLIRTPHPNSEDLNKKIRTVNK